MHHATLSSQPHEEAFGRDLGVELRWMVDAGVQEAQLELHPADLGPIRMQLTLAAQTADISLAAAHPATREGLAQALPALRELLAAQGLQLGQAAVAGGQTGSSFGAPQRQQPATARARTMGGIPTELGAGVARLRPGRGMLDLYA